MQRPKTSYLDAQFGTLTQRSVHPTAPVLLTKIQEMRSVPTFSLHSASISRILEPSPQGLILGKCKVELQFFQGLFIYYVITCREEGGQKMTISFAYFEGYINAYILHMQMETGEGAWVQKCLKLCLRNEWSQSTLPLNTTGPFAGLKLIKDSIKKDTNFENGITICLRFRISERMSCKESAIFFRKSCIYGPYETKSLKLSKFQIFGIKSLLAKYVPSRSMEHTAMRKLERLQFSTSSLFDKI